MFRKDNLSLGRTTTIFFDWVIGAAILVSHIGAECLLQDCVRGKGFLVLMGSLLVLMGGSPWQF